MTKEILIVVATRSIKEETEIWKSAKRMQVLYPLIEWEFIEKNTRGLPEIYNTYINDRYKNHIVVFAHDDLLIEDLFFAGKIRKAHESYDVVGLAGGNLQKPINEMKFKSPHQPALWHLMVPRSAMSGNVMHPEFTQNGSSLVRGHGVQTTSFGISPQKVDILDGLFLSVNIENALTHNVKFDEQFMFHHYDIDFALSSTNAGMSCGTWPIHVTHMSPGLRSFDAKFLESEEKFSKKYTQ